MAAATGSSNVINSRSVCMCALCVYGVPYSHRLISYHHSMACHILIASSHIISKRSYWSTVHRSNRFNYLSAHWLWMASDMQRQADQQLITKHFPIFQPVRQWLLSSRSSSSSGLSRSVHPKSQCVECVAITAKSVRREDTSTSVRTETAAATSAS